MKVNYYNILDHIQAVIEEADENGKRIKSIEVTGNEAAELRRELRKKGLDNCIEPFPPFLPLEVLHAIPLHVATYMGIEIIRVW